MKPKIILTITPSKSLEIQSTVPVEVLCIDMQRDETRIYKDLPVMTTSEEDYKRAIKRGRDDRKTA